MNTEQILRHVYFTPLCLPETTQVSNEEELDDIIDIDNSNRDANRSKNTSELQEKNSRNKRKMNTENNAACSSSTVGRETLKPKLLSKLDPDDDIEKFIKNLDVVVGSSIKRVRFSFNTVEKFKLHIVTSDEIKNIAKTSVDKIECLDYGTFCHQCEKTTLDTKSVCHNSDCIDDKGQLCGPCLRTRYGEDLATILHEFTWICPCCRGICNCSSCRFLDGKVSADNLYCIAVAFGYKSVHHLLKLQKDD